MELSQSHPALRQHNLTYEHIKQSVLRLNIYYQTMEYTHISEKPKINIVDLLANIGGTLGLCLGLSVLSFIEMFEIMAKVCLVLVKRSKFDNGEQN